MAQEAKGPSSGGNILEIKVMVESLGAVDMSNEEKGKGVTSKASNVKRIKWTRRQGVRKTNPIQDKKLNLEIGKRHFVDVMIIDGTVGGCGKGENKLKGQETGKEIHDSELEVVLEDPYRLQQ